MAVLTLSNGDTLMPRSLFDVMDSIEECMGPDVRDYLEDYFEGTEKVEITDEDLKEHYLELMQFIEREMQQIMSAPGKRKKVFETAQLVAKTCKRNME